MNPGTSQLSDTRSGNSQKRYALLVVEVTSKFVALAGSVMVTIVSSNRVVCMLLSGLVFYATV